MVVIISSFFAKKISDLRLLISLTKKAKKYCRINDFCPAHQCLQFILWLFTRQRFVCPEIDGIRVQLEPSVTRERSTTEKNAINNLCLADQCLQFILIAFFKTTLSLSRNRLNPCSTSIICNWQTKYHPENCHL